MRFLTRQQQQKLDQQFHQWTPPSHLHLNVMPVTQCQQWMRQSHLSTHLLWQLWQLCHCLPAQWQPLPGLAYPECALVLYWIQYLLQNGQNAQLPRQLPVAMRDEVWQWWLSRNPHLSAGSQSEPATLVDSVMSSRKSSFMDENAAPSSSLMPTLSHGAPMPSIPPALPLSSAPLNHHQQNPSLHGYTSSSAPIPPSVPVTASLNPSFMPTTTSTATIPATTSLNPQTPSINGSASSSASIPAPAPPAVPVATLSHQQKHITPADTLTPPAPPPAPPVLPSSTLSNTQKQTIQDTAFTTASPPAVPVTTSSSQPISPPSINPELRQLQQELDTLRSKQQSISQASKERLRLDWETERIRDARLFHYKFTRDASIDALNGVESISVGAATATVSEDVSLGQQKLAENVQEETPEERIKRKAAALLAQRMAQLSVHVPNMSGRDEKKTNQATDSTPDRVPDDAKARLELIKKRLEREHEDRMKEINTSVQSLDRRIRILKGERVDPKEESASGFVTPAVMPSPPSQTVPIPSPPETLVQPSTLSSITSTIPLKSDAILKAPSPPLPLTTAKPPFKSAPKPAAPVPPSALQGKTTIPSHPAPKPPLSKQPESTLALKSQQTVTEEHAASVPKITVSGTRDLSEPSKIQHVKAKFESPTTISDQKTAPVPSSSANRSKSAELPRTTIPLKAPAESTKGNVNHNPFERSSSQQSFNSDSSMENVKVNVPLSPSAQSPENPFLVYVESPDEEEAEVEHPSGPLGRRASSIDNIFSDEYGVANDALVFNEIRPLAIQIPDSEDALPFLIVQAQFEYQPVDKEEIALVVDEFLAVPDPSFPASKLLDFSAMAEDVRIEPPSDWWYGQRAAQHGHARGYFPASYVSIVADLRRSLNHLLDFGIYDAIYPFHSEESDELSLEEGSRVLRLSRNDEQWWVCVLIKNVGVRTWNGLGKVGLCPASYLVRVDPEELESPLPTSRESPLKSPTGSISRQPSFMKRKSDAGSSLSLVHATSQDSISTQGMGPRRLSDIQMIESSLLNSVLEYAKWSEYVSTAVATNMPADDKKRQDAIFELIHTEATYLRNLQIIIEVFYNPMRQSRLLSSTDISSIFCNMDCLYRCNSRIFCDMVSLQLKDKGVIQNIGRLLLEHAAIVRPHRREELASSKVPSEITLLAYYRYCSNQKLACDLLQTRRSEHVPFAEFLQSCMKNPRCRSLDLSSYLLEPMQRITRYPLLVKQILHYTPKEHPDHPDLLQALELLETLLSDVNSAAKDVENTLKLRDISAKVDLSPFYEQGGRLDIKGMTRSLGKRELLYEGPLTKTKSGRKLYAYLFNDLILFCEPTNSRSTPGPSDKPWIIYRKPLSLAETKAMERSRSFSHLSSDHSGDLSFQIINNQGDALLVKAPDKKSKTAWLQKIEAAHLAYHQAEEHHKHFGTGSSLMRYPKNCIGTLCVLLWDLQSVPAATPKTQYYCCVQLNTQQLKSNPKEVTVINEMEQVYWDEAMMFSVRSLDESLSFTVYQCDPYAQDECLGTAEIGIDFLEYYCGKETERIELTLKEQTGQLHFTLNYKTQL